MVMPAIHLSRTQVADTFTKETGKHQTEDITSLVRVARRELRRKFAEADMGISGMNFAVAESGAIGLVTNEGNARMVTTLPRVHVAVGGIDKLIPSFDDAMATLRVLPRNATGQHLTSLRHVDRRRRAHGFRARRQEEYARGVRGQWP